jgi:hypothetical protein
MAVSLVKTPTGNPSFNLLKKPPRRSQFNIGFDEPPGGLVPLGDTGLWTTPDEPADPQDCERYEGSAFCTPFFFTLTPFSFIPAIAIDECNIGIRLDYSFGFIRLPPVALVYRNPSEDCKPPPPPVLPPGDNAPVPFPFNSCDDSTQSIIVVYAAMKTGTQDRNVTIANLNVGVGYYYSHSTTSISITSIEFPYRGEIGGRYTDARGETHYEYSAKINYTFAIDQQSSEAYRDEYLGRDSPLSVHNEGSAYLMMKDSDDEALDNPTSILILQTNVSTAKEKLKDLRNTSDVFSYTDIEGNLEGYFLTRNQYAVIVKCGKTSNNFNPPPPPEYNPPPRRCCMSCCPSQGEPDNSLLNLLIQKVDKLSNIVGVNEYPISLPQSLISKDEGFLGNLIPNKNVEIPNLTVLQAWCIERFDEIMGQWEIPIEIKDSDPSKPGDQPIGIKLPNMAEAIAEMFILCFQTNINSETALNLAMRNMSETVADKQQNFITYKLLQSLTDWVGFKQKDINLKMPLNITLNKTRYDEILKESEVDVGVVEFDDKFGLEADLMRFREGMAILQATSKRKIDPKGDIKAQILKYLLDTFKATEKVNGEDDEQDFEDFLKEVETGFINTAGIKDAINPYGRPFSQRPRIKDLTKYEPPKEP